MIMILAYFTLCIVHVAQLELAFCYNNNCEGEFDVMTIEDCCLNNPDGLSFVRFGSEACEPCVGMCMLV